VTSRDLWASTAASNWRYRSKSPRHLPGDRANSFVAELTALADVVLFSAALPYQGGTGHVNENWPEYWADKFRKRGYVLVDLFRPGPLARPTGRLLVPPQNTFLYVRAEQIGALGLAAWRLGDMPLSSVHPELLLWVCARARGIGNAFERDRTYWNDAVHAYQAARPSPSTNRATAGNTKCDLAGLVFYAA
jgi:hypothetical protein